MGEVIDAFSSSDSDVVESLFSSDDSSNSINHLSQNDESLAMRLQTNSDVRSTTTENVTCHSSTGLHRNNMKLKILRSGFQIASEHCCSLKCLEQFSIDRLGGIEKEMKSRSSSDKKNFLTSLIDKQLKWCTEKAKFIPDNFLDGKHICPRAFMHIYDISHYSYNELIKNVSSKGHSRSIHGNSKLMKIRKGTATVIGALRVFLDENAQHLPNFSYKIVTTFQTKKHVFQYIRRSIEFKTDGQNFLSYRRFLQIWNAYFPQFKVKKMQGVVYCATCTGLLDRLRKSKTNEEYVENDKLWQMHMKHVKQSYEYFYTVVQRAQTEKYNQDCVEIDGMDQRKTDLPRFCQEDKDTSTSLKLRTHVTGAIVYTNVDNGEMPFLYYDLCQFPHDVNIVITVLLKCLVAKPQRPRSKLHLQLDNTAKENKNRFMMTFCSILVSLDLYDEVILMFHPVGHTHSRVDALFSRVSVALSATDICTLAEFQERLKESQGETGSRPYVEELTEILDVKKWMPPSVERIFEGLMHKHFFWFYKKDNVVRMKYKNYCGDPDWLPQIENDHDDIKDGYRMLKNLPDLDIIPDYVEPSFTLKSTGTVILDPKNLKRQILTKCVHRLSHEQISAWDEFLSHDVEKLLEIPEPTEIWPMTILLTSKRWERQSSVETAALDSKAVNITNESNLKIVKKLTGGNRLIIGDQGRPKFDKVPDGHALKEINEGSLLAVRPDITNLEPTTTKKDFKANPWICQAKSKPDDHGMLEVQWLTGKLNGAWNLEMRRTNTKSKKKFVQDNIHVNSIYLWNFKLLQNKHLEKSALDTVAVEMEKIQQAYDAMYSPDENNENDDIEDEDIEY